MSQLHYYLVSASQNPVELKLSGTYGFGFIMKARDNEYLSEKDEFGQPTNEAPWAQVSFPIDSPEAELLRGLIAKGFAYSFFAEGLSDIVGELPGRLFEGVYQPARPLREILGLDVNSVTLLDTALTPVDSALVVTVPTTAAQPAAPVAPRAKPSSITRLLLAGAKDLQAKEAAKAAKATAADFS